MKNDEKVIDQQKVTIFDKKIIQKSYQLLILPKKLPTTYEELTFLSKCFLY